jgi:hypothetical protein
VDVRGIFVSAELRDIRAGAEGAVERLAELLSHALRTRSHDLHQAEIDALISLLQGIAKKRGTAARAWGGRAGRPPPQERNAAIFEEVENLLAGHGKSDSRSVEDAVTQVASSHGLGYDTVKRIYDRWRRAHEKHRKACL